MAHIKDISKFSQDAINMSMEALTDDEKHALDNNLKRMYNTLMSASSNVKGPEKPITKRGVSDEELFREEILPKIERKLKEIENTEYKGQIRTVTLDFNLNVQFEKMDFQQLMEEHKKIVKLDGELAQAALVVKFLRGKIYIYLQDAAQKQKTVFKDFVEKLGLVYRTVLRYMLIAQMILKYPRLLLCDINFTQLLVYKSKLLKFFTKEGKELADRLAGPVYMEVQGMPISIQHCDINLTMKTTMKTPADWEVRDVYEESPSEQAVAAMASDTVKKISECPDEIEELEEMLTHI